VSAVQLCLQKEAFHFLALPQPACCSYCRLEQQGAAGSVTALPMTAVLKDDSNSPCWHVLGKSWGAGRKMRESSYMWVQSPSQMV
jgi:hypothetical protein